jgi:hypothetical protein
MQGIDTAFDERRPARKAAPSMPSALVADPGDLVARALAILAEETAEWHARRAEDFTTGGTG